MITEKSEVVAKGFEFNTNNKMVTLFSVSDYCGEFDNDGAVLLIDEKLECKFYVLPSKNTKNKLSQ